MEETSLESLVAQVTKLAETNVELGKKCVELIDKQEDARSRDEVLAEVNRLADKVHALAFSEEGFRALTPLERVEDMVNQMKRTNDRLAKLHELVRWAAQATHQGHHHDAVNFNVTWQECSRGFCASIRNSLDQLGFVETT